jgi:hypothetical protein
MNRSGEHEFKFNRNKHRPKFIFEELKQEG